MVARGLILRHVLEHISKPEQFLQSLRDANGGKGLIYIEVPCFDWICTRHAWFDIFYEHVNYFRMSDMLGMFDRIISSGHLFGGQYMYVIADLASLKTPSINTAGVANFPVELLKNPWRREEQSTAPVAVWGGASKGVIFSLLREQSGHPVTWVIDINPAKQGLFLPVTGLQAKSPSMALTEIPPGTTVYVMNSNYLSEIKEMSNHAYHYVSIDNE